MVTSICPTPSSTISTHKVFSTNSPFHTLQNRMAFPNARIARLWVSFGPCSFDTTHIVTSGQAPSPQTFTSVIGFHPDPYRTILLLIIFGFAPDQKSNTFASLDVHAGMFCSDLSLRSLTVAQPRIMLGYSLVSKAYMICGAAARRVVISPNVYFYTRPRAGFENISSDVSTDYLASKHSPITELITSHDTKT